MNYFSVFLPSSVVFDIKEAVGEAIKKKAELIFADSIPGHENNHYFWPRFVALRDLYLCLEGADISQKGLSICPIDYDTNSQTPTHLAAEFTFISDSEEEDKP